VNPDRIVKMNGVWFYQKWTTNFWKSFGSGKTRREAQDDYKSRQKAAFVFKATPAGQFTFSSDSHFAALDSAINA